MTTQINVTPWRGWRTTFGNADLYHAIHTKSLQRRPIDGTYVEAVARRTAGDKNEGQYLSVGQRVREVYHSCLQFEGPEKEWEFSRILGCGSFGLACLWQRLDASTCTDELVTKSETPKPKLAIHINNSGISKEVFHLAQLNERPNQQGKPRVGVVRLRGFKAIAGERSTQGDGSYVFPLAPDLGHGQEPLYREWRTFMENCTYGTLTRVMLTYKAWGFHVPEAFVWWTFLWLMEACKAMDEDAKDGFWEVEDNGQVTNFPRTFMLSNDIKHDNIFVGNSRQDHDYALGAPFDIYPAARMGDFGLSRLAQLNQHNRPGRFPAGTAPWMAPEKRSVSMGFDIHARNAYLFYQPTRVDAASWNATNGVPRTTDSHCIGPEANVWSAALAIYLLMTLEDVRDIDAIVRHKISLDNVHRDDGNVAQYLFDVDDFATFLEDDEDYSYELKKLVQECTRMEPTKRPHVDTILNAIHAGIRREHDRLRSEFGDDGEIYDATRMAFTNQDWYNVPEGPFEMIPRSVPGVSGGGSEATRRGWRDFHQVVEEWADPTAPTLVPPRQWRIYRDGDPAPTNWTAKQPEPDFPVRWPMPLPYYGGDWVLYTERDFIEGYHQGRPLPPGGRAWKWQLANME